jgi:hypothetical protein
MTNLSFLEAKMKRFIVTILCVSVFFIGLGGLVDNVGARLKSDARALELIKAAQQAIGGDSAIRNVQSLTIAGKATKTFEIEGVARSEQGDWELNLQLPNKLSKMMRMTIEKDDTGEKSENKVFTVTKKDGGQAALTTNEKPVQDVVIVKRGGEGGTVIVNEENTNGDVKKEVIRDKMRGEFEKHKQMELFRTTLSLLLSAPQGVEADYIYAGDGSVDGISCDVIEARVGESSVKLFLDKASHLPRMMSYMDHKPMMMFRIKKDDAKAEENIEKTQQTFERKVEAPPTEEFQIKFSDYRSVGGLLLPFKWTQTVSGRADETVDISSYEINPANIADKFNELPQKIMMRTEKKP